MPCPAWLALSPATRLQHVSALNGLFRDARRHGWDDGALPAGAVFYPEDYPKIGRRLPRAVAEHIMTQVEAPSSLDRWANPSYRLITLILIRCGLRITDACKIPADCVVTDPDGAPYLRYYNHKMRREALVPVDEELTGQIAAQRQRTAERWTGGTPVLFPRPHANLRGIRPTGGGTYREALYAWLETCDIRDEHGKPVHLTPHQWRHTLGTRLKVSGVASAASFGTSREHALPAAQRAALRHGWRAGAAGGVVTCDVSGWLHQTPGCAI